MKRKAVQWITGVALVSLVAGCADPYGRPDYTGSGALVGGASGALLGASIDRRNPGAGALIGGAAGLITGALIGHSMDQEKEYRNPPPPPPTVIYTTTPAPAPPAVPAPTVEEVKSMARAGVNDDAIITQIQNSRGVYKLDANTIIDLKNAGVSEKVISAMVSASGDVVASQSPPPPPSETVVVQPGPDYYWVSGEWRWSGTSWVWVPGRWTPRPAYGAVWVPTRWVRGPWGWRRIPGHWQY